MFGYIYITENNITNDKYIGKHKSSKYEPSYLGSGKLIKEAIAKYGKCNFSNKMIYIAETKIELDEAEKVYIKKYKRDYGNCIYNIAAGGDGGNVFCYATEDEKKIFQNKMTKVNRERCSSDDFKQKISAAGKKRYANQEEREIQSKRIRAAWNDQALREKQSRILQNYYQTHVKDNSYNNIPSVFELGNTRIEFDSKKQMLSYLKGKYHFSPCEKTIRQLYNTGKSYKPFHKKDIRMTGMRIYSKQSKSVETMGDECSPVGCETGTHPKRKTEIENIVHPA